MLQHHLAPYCRSAVCCRVHLMGLSAVQVVFSRDGRFLAAATWGSDVKIWELTFGRDGAFKSCKKAMELKGHASGVHAVAFNAASTRAVTASKDGTLRTWRLDVQCAPRCQCAAATSAAANHLTTCMSPASIQNLLPGCNVEHYVCQVQVFPPSLEHRSALWSLERRSALWYRYEQNVDPKCLVKARLEGKPYSHLVWCPNDVIVGSCGAALHYIDAATGTVTDRVQDAHSRDITGLVASSAPVSCGDLEEVVVVSCSRDRKARVWAVPS
jgi:WD40 repeat protein